MVSSDLLRRYPFFSALTQAQAARVAALAEEAHFKEDDVLFHAGHPADALYLLVDGHVELYHNVKEEDEADARTAGVLYRVTGGGAGMPLATPVDAAFKQQRAGGIEPGEIAGISALIEPYQYTATARVTRPGRLVKIDAIALRRLCSNDPHLACAVLRAAARTAMERLHFTRVQLAGCRA